MLQFSVSTLPYSLKCITEAKVGFDRLQRVLLLKGKQTIKRDLEHGAA